jgi:hypothetical protein
MNRVLFKAAAIVNIAAAALIYVACSGDDGKDGKDGAGCIAQVNAVAGGHDIVCGGVVYGNIKDGVQGPPGTATTGACTGTAVANGIAITCNGEFVGIVTNGEPGPQGPAGPGGGGGPGGLCTTEAFAIPGSSSGDRGIQIICDGNPQNFYAKLITCPIDSWIYTGSEFCDADGRVSTGGGLILCGGATYNPTREFCQRTVAATGALAGLYPQTANFDFDAQDFPTKLSVTGGPANQLGDTAFAYHKLEKDPAVTSVKKPLCGGVAIYTGTPSVLTSTKAFGSATVTRILGSGSTAANQVLGAGIYDANSQCARNLIVKNDVIPSLEINSQFTSDWAKVDGINAFFTDDKGQPVLSPGTPYTFTAALTFLNAQKDPYTRCPAGTGVDASDIYGVVELDNRKCVNRLTPGTDGKLACLYHSSIDNTCYGPAAAAVVIGKPKELPSTAANGIFAANINDIEWSRSCVTRERTVYYVVNDPNLVSRDVREGSRNTGLSAPICEDLTPVPGSTPPVATQAAVAFEDAFDCLNNASLSVAIPANNGTAWNKPLRCDTPEQACIAKGGAITPPSTECLYAAGTTKALCENGSVAGTYVPATGTSDLTLGGTVTVTGTQTAVDAIAAAAQTALRGVTGVGNAITVAASAIVTLGSSNLTLGGTQTATGTDQDDCNTVQAAAQTDLRAVTGVGAITVTATYNGTACDITIGGVIAVSGANQNDVDDIATAAQTALRDVTGVSSAITVTASTLVPGTTGTSTLSLGTPEINGENQTACSAVATAAQTALRGVTGVSSAITVTASAFNPISASKCTL